MTTGNHPLVTASPLSAVERDSRANEAADEFMRLIAAMDIFMIDEAARLRLIRMAGTALANRFVFACLDDDPGSERAVWVFMPLSIWAGTRQLFTVPAPLDPLLPDDAMEVGDGVWLWDDNKSKTDRALALMARGFIWDPTFQRRVDATQEPLIAAIARHMPRPPPAPRP